MRRGFSAILISLIVILSISGTACKKKERSAHVPGSDAYSCVFYDLPMKEGFEAMFSKIFMCGEDFCITAIYRRYNQETKDYEEWTDIMTVDQKGRTTFILEFPGNQLPSAVLPQEYAYIGVNKEELSTMDQPDVSKLDNRAVFLDKKTGEVTKRLDAGFQIIFIAPVTGGFVLGGSNELARYTSDGRLQDTIHTSFHISHNNSFFEDNGHFYVVEDKDESTFVYHEADFETGTCRRIADTSEVGADITGFRGKYFFNSDGEYKVDLETMQVAKLADWNCVDIRPQKKSLRLQNEYYSLDDNHFARRYAYSDGTFEILLFSYDPSINVEERTKITIGGYDVHDDLALQWMVYNFNTENKEYRAVLEDYSMRFSGVGLDGMYKAKLNLMKYFSEGNTPDIFYGQYFDYEYMGRNGMVKDMRPYLEQSTEWMDSLTETAQKLMISGDGACYQVFASYWLNGNEGVRRHYSDGTDVSITQLSEISEETGIPISISRIDVAVSVMDWALAYDFPKLWGVYDGGKAITREQLEDILSIAIEAENEASSGGGGDYTSQIGDDVCLLEGTMIGDFYGYVATENDVKEPICFLGFPSVNGSVHLAMPNCCVAISTSTQYPEKCWELCRGLFTEEVQKTVAVNGEIPINQKIVELVCQAVRKPDSVSDEIIRSYVYEQKPADEQVVERYLEAIRSADTLACYDWGLFTIVYDEVNSYYTQQRDVRQIAETLEKRLDLYAEENYQ